MLTSNESRTETLRGTVVAIALVAIGLGVFLAFALGKHLHPPELHAKPRPPERPLQRAEESSPRGKKNEEGTMPPGAAGGDGNRGAAGGGVGGAAGNGAGTVANFSADSVRDALHEVLEDYRANPGKTSVVSISSRGLVNLQIGGPLTSLDGLPAEAVRHGTVLEGAPVGSQARGN
jgi:hypothetical protein